uniref:DDE Tnp4 domain-containing protein n=1 Tax=Amphimedon queenslandica TaxID=400682 RepID=A0A1X7V675_AMPQE
RLNKVDSTRQLPHVRIHVEIVLGQLKKKYPILQIVPIKQLNNDKNCTIDNIVTVCCALCNLCE